MPKREKSEKPKMTTKFRIMFRGGAADNRIEEIVVDVLPHVLYAPVGPLNFSTVIAETTWRTASYRLSTDPGEYDIQAFYDLDSVA